MNDQQDPISKEVLDKLNGLLSARDHRFESLVRLAGLNPGSDLRLMDLSGVDFRGADLTGFDFSGSDLRYANFTDARISGAHFRGANLKGASVQQATDFRESRARLAEAAGIDADGRCSPADRATRLVLEALEQLIADPSFRDLPHDLSTILPELRAVVLSTDPDLDRFITWRQDLDAMSKAPLGGLLLALEAWLGQFAAKLPPGALYRHLPESWCPQMIVIPTGRFLMGTSEDDKDGFSSERPQHEVSISKRFSLARYAVTESQYHGLLGKGLEQQPEVGAKGGWLPKTRVSWHEAIAYCEALSDRTGKTYRLPSEAEWEYACRAGSASRYPWGDEITPDHANYLESKIGRATEVGNYPANSWGLHGMIGNVWEWCADHWHDDYQGAPTDGSAWLASPSPGRVVRGGSWFDFARLRACGVPQPVAIQATGSDYLGFRCAGVQEA